MQHRTDIYFTKKINVYEALVSSGIVIEADCGGKHSCGKCFVFVDGAAEKPMKDEVKLLSFTELKRPHLLNDNAQLRLACFCDAIGDCNVYYKDRAKEKPLEKITMTTEIQKIREHNAYLGATVDIGTTTVECELYDLVTEERLFYMRERNAQSVFGSDVLSRIERSNKNGPGEQKKKIVDQIYRMLRDGAALSLVDPERIVRIVVTGNTTMLHFFAGLDPRGIGVAPFTPECLFGYEMEAKEIFDAFHRADLYIAPCIGAYIGGDISCGVLSTCLTEPGKVNLLVDVGTNGEISLSVNERAVCCSTAAGPAFEGGEIVMGMVASSGAIYDVFLDDGEIKYRTVDNAAAIGLCGTGIITAVETFLKAGILDETGRIKPDGHPFCDRMATIDGGYAVYIARDTVYLTQKDIRNVQLAKAAIAAGIETLLHETSLTGDMVDQVYLSGGFGSGINPDSAAAVGLLPNDFVNRTRSTGNSALKGAAMILLHEENREAVQRIAGNADEIALSANAFFMDAYIDKMHFEMGK